MLYLTSNFMWLLIFWQLTFISCIVFCFLTSSCLVRGWTKAANKQPTRDAKSSALIARGKVRDYKD